MGRLIARHIREQLPSYRLGGLFRTTAHAEARAGVETFRCWACNSSSKHAICSLKPQCRRHAGYRAGLPCRRKSRRAVERRRIFASIPLCCAGCGGGPRGGACAVRAIAGLDGIRAMREMGLDAVTLTTEASPQPRPDAASLSSSRPRRKRQRDHVPRSAAAVQRHGGRGDPAFPRKRERRGQPWPGGARFFPYAGAPVRGSPCGRDSAPYFGQGQGLHIETMTRPAPLPQNPRSSALAMYSVPALLRGLAANPKLAG